MKNVEAPPLSVLLSNEMVNDDPSLEKMTESSIGVGGSWSALSTTKESPFISPFGYVTKYSCAEGPVSCIQYL